MTITRQVGTRRTRRAATVPDEERTVTDLDRAEWRAQGLKAGDDYGSELAALARGDVGDLQFQDLVASMGVKLREEAQRLRDMATPEELIEEFTRAAVERVMLRMHATHTAFDTSS
ncbi:hypothetical protein [Methylobacterium sp. Leaf117]|uniref:hypothetical protein n=1 Tax=Methylobacterium sp. Leaf117 TaxID=1736260 RepID=UPI0012E10E73|nr:hypothetical protein [Methylobacterium sp. Leaf117]